MQESKFIVNVIVRKKDKNNDASSSSKNTCSFFSCLRHAAAGPVQMDLDFAWHLLHPPPPLPKLSTPTPFQEEKPIEAINKICHWPRKKTTDKQDSSKKEEKTFTANAGTAAISKKSHASICFSSLGHLLDPSSHKQC